MPILVIFSALVCFALVGGFGVLASLAFFAGQVVFVLICLVWGGIWQLRIKS